MAQLSEIQSGLIRDVGAFANAHALGNSNAVIEENAYRGNYRELVTAVSTIVSAFEKGKVESAREIDELRKKIDAIARELQQAQNDLVQAKNETDATKEAVEAAKQETVHVREEAANMRSELATANTEAASAKRDAATARRESDRLAAQLKAATLPRPSIAPPQRPSAAPATPPPSTRLRSHDSAPSGSLKSAKVAAPSGAYEYDRKDYGKF
jgi:septal ring factor EnvC (AmiA/AmiB activator)